LKAGVDWLSARKPKELAAHDLKLSLLFLNWLSQQNKLELVGVNQEDLKDMLRQAENDPSSFTRLPIYLVNAKGMSAALLADRLDSHYNIAVRHGLQCAMLAHKNLGTLESGAVRISFGPLNTEDEVEFLCQSLERICA
jgi:selenocysteine lyase/cysteine desulfurase